MKRAARLFACTICVLSLTGCYTRGGWYWDPFLSVGCGDCKLFDGDGELFDCNGDNGGRGRCAPAGGECCPPMGCPDCSPGVYSYPGVPGEMMVPGGPMMAPTPATAPMIAPPAVSQNGGHPQHYVRSPQGVPPAAYEGPTPAPAIRGQGVPMDARNVPVDAPRRL